MMKKVLLFVLPLALLHLCASAQSDTVYHYYSKDFRETTKDSSFSFVKMYKKDNSWFGVEYYNKGNIVRSEGNFTNADAKTPIGSFNNYNESGILDNTADYAEGKTLSKKYFYKNGAKKSYISYSGQGENKQMGWDEQGKEIKNFVVEREARFKGGAEGWRKYLEKNLNANVAADAGAPAGTYEIKLQFIVNKEGYVNNVKAVSVPAACKPCGREAVNVVSSGPQWEHAIQNNEPVIYQAIQFITFVVEETKKGKKN